jgi:hypothetical protein
MQSRKRVGKQLLPEPTAPRRLPTQVNVVTTIDVEVELAARNRS